MGKRNTARLQQEVEELDRLVRSGEAGVVRKRLSLLSGQKLPRSLLLPLAGLGRRVGLTGFALRLLHPVIRSEPPVHPPASPSERALYGAVLLKIGARKEAIELLTGIESRATPEALLFMSYALFSEWKYGLAVPLLRQYVRHPLIDPYQRQIGEVNLAAALVVTGKFVDAEARLQELLEDTERDGLRLLQGNTLELLTQLEVLRGHYGQASAYIQRAGDILVKSGDQNTLFMEKWRAVVDLCEAPESAEARERLALVRSKAIEQGHWEVVRDCDFQCAVATKRHPSLAQRLVFGTPHVAFRRRVLATIGRVELPDAFVWQPSIKPDYRLPQEASANEPPHFNLAAATSADGTLLLKRGQILHRALWSLAVDFYRPRSVGEIFADLYPDEVFNPTSSPQRVARVVQRLREWMSRSQLPLSLMVRNGDHRLQATGSFGIKVDKAAMGGHTRHIPDRGAQLAQTIRDYWQDQVFTAREAAKALGLSVDRVQEIIAPLLEKGDLIRTAGGRSTSYRFVRAGVSK